MPTTPPLLGRETIENLHCLAWFLAGAVEERPSNIRLAQSALMNDPGGHTFAWFASEFEATSTRNETIWWFGPHRFKTEPQRDTVALAIGPRGLTGEDATRFYRIDNGVLYKEELETESKDIVERRRDLIASWDEEDACLLRAQQWHTLSLEQIRFDLARNKDRQTNAPRRLVVERVLAKGTAITWLDAFLAYEALGMNPARAIACAVGDDKLPHTSQE